MNRPGRLLFGGMTANKGGKEAFIMNAFRSLNQDYECWFLADQEIAFRDEILAEGGHIAPITPRGKSPLKYLADLRRIFRDVQFDAIWLNQTVVNSIEPLVLAKMAGVEHRILHSHSSRNMGSRLTGFLHYSQRPFAGLFANRKFACSEPAAHWFYGNGDYLFIPNSFPAEKFTFDPVIREEARRDLGIADDTILLTHVARFGDEKNHEFGLGVLRRIVERGQSAALVLVGDGALRPHIEQLVVEQGLAQRVHFTGMISDVSRILQAGDVSILPSKFEGLPFTILEASAAGLPCVVSDVVTPEANVTGTVRFVPLSAGEDRWADIILEAARDEVRTAGVNPVLGTRFDITMSRDFLTSAIVSESVSRRS